MRATVFAAPVSLLDLDATFLPVAQMRQISRVTTIEGSRIPGTLIIEAAGQLVALWGWSNGHRGRPRLVRTSASFHHPVARATPALKLEAEVRGKRHLQFGTVDVLAEGMLVARVEAVLAVLPGS